MADDRRPVIGRLDLDTDLSTLSRRAISPWAFRFPCVFSFVSRLVGLWYITCRPSPYCYTMVSDGTGTKVVAYPSCPRGSFEGSNRLADAGLTLVFCFPPSCAFCQAWHVPSRRLGKAGSRWRSAGCACAGSGRESGVNASAARRMGLGRATQKRGGWMGYAWTWSRKICARASLPRVDLGVSLNMMWERGQRLR